MSTQINLFIFSPHSDQISLCQKMLPRGWLISDAAVLCNDISAPSSSTQGQGQKKIVSSSSNSALQEVVQCAVDVTRLLTYGGAGGSNKHENSNELGLWSHRQAAVICSRFDHFLFFLHCVCLIIFISHFIFLRSENVNGNVRKCVAAATPSPSSSPLQNAHYINPELIGLVCGSPSSEGSSGNAAGACLSKLAALSSTSFSLSEPAAAAHICQSSSPSIVLRCLEKVGKKIVSPLDINSCLSAPRILKYAEVVHVFSSFFQARNEPSKS